MAHCAVIPARGGSKRIPRKNIRRFAGRPMIAHAIEAALSSGCFDAVVVSTEDEEIADVARACGAEVPFIRPDKLADDHTATVPVIQHAVRTLASTGRDFDLVCCLYATAPFVTRDLLREGLERLVRSGKSYAFTVAEFPSRIQRALRIREDGRVEPMWPENALLRTQDLEPAFYDAGQFYWGTVDAWLQGLTIHGPRSVPVVVPTHRVVDIDTPEDWARAEVLHRLLRETDA